LRAGFSETQMQQLRHSDLRDFADRDRALIAYCDAMTRDIRVPDHTFEAIRPYFNNQELVEVTATIGAYNMVSRFLEALQIDHD
ncbi:MAG: carboxymuconolactone decarboxylase family protein, partial [Advenella sp.]